MNNEVRKRVGRLSDLKVAVVTDALTVYGGAERVLEQIIGLFPQARLFALVDFRSRNNASFLNDRRATTTFIQTLPFADKHFRSYLQLWPIAVEQLDVSEFDLVISSQYAVAHGVVTGPGQTHLVYTHSPMRYAWDLQKQYLSAEGDKGRFSNWYVRRALHKLRLWDHAAAQRVDRFACNSSFVSTRIQKFYRRESEVIYPPVDTDGFQMSGKKQDHFVTVSRLVPYKRVDLIVSAFNQMPDKKLVVFGDGPELGRLKAMAGPNVEVAGHCSSAQLRAQVSSAAAFVFAAVEDFGISPVEAQACGTPVIGLGQGGLVETVRGLDSAQPTGVLFDEQTAESIIAGVHEFDRHRDAFSPQVCRNNALAFSPERFRQRFLGFVETSLAAERVVSTRPESIALRKVQWKYPAITAAEKQEPAPAGGQ